MPCHAIRITANDKNSEYPNRKNSGSYVVSSVVIACWTVGTRLSDVWGGMNSFLLWSGLAPRPERITRPGRERSIRRRPAAPRRHLHIDLGSVRIAGPLRVDEQLLDERRQ